jgi:hypothetical protein
MEFNKVSAAIIEGYQKVILDRYQYEKLKSRYTIPESITENHFNNLRNYFLEYIYPSEQKRQDLNEAFESLDGHIRHPDQLLRIIIDSGSLVFKFGWHLPKVLKAGIKALKSFRIASRFEEQLVNHAIVMNLQPPFSPSDIKLLMASLTKKDLYKFMDDGMSLFQTLHDQPLVLKIIEIIDHIIKVMRKRPKVYSEKEIKGLELGREVIVEGNKLFDELKAEEQALLFVTVYQIEKDAIDVILQEE